MLTNKLIQKIIFSQFRNTSLYLFAAEKKAPNPTQTPKVAQVKPKTQNKPNLPLTNANKASTDKKQQEPVVSGLFSIRSHSGAFYRKMVRSLNFKKKTGRAIFHQQSLRQIIDTASRKDLNLIFEAYYNFLGHYTLVSNTTVDALVKKAISLGTICDQISEQAITKVFITLKNHEYLGYFPHYSTTLKSAQFAIKSNKYPQFLNILNSKLLIKLDRETIKGLYNITKQWKDFIRLTNIVIYRARLNLFKNIPNQELINNFTQSLKKFTNLSQNKVKFEIQLFVKKLNQAKEQALKKENQKLKRLQFKQKQTIPQTAQQNKQKEGQTQKAVQ